MDDFEQIMKDAGGTTAVAGRLGVTAQRLSNWGARGVPLEHCRPFIKATGDRLHVSDLRPNDWWIIWPELAAERPDLIPPDMFRTPAVPAPTQEAA